MQLTHIQLQQFRSYKKQKFLFSPQTTLIVGPNTAGKTNILEAIFALATGKSFRADKEGEMIFWNEEVGRVIAEIMGAGDEKEKLEIVLTNSMVQGQKTQAKKYLVNGVARRQVDFVGNLRAVLFWPEHLELVTASPSLRRRYLDSVLVQVDREYRRNLYSYERGLRQRNKLLDAIKEGMAHRQQLLFWDQLLIKAGGFITEKRAAFIDFINIYQLSGVMHHIEYDKSIISESRLDQYKDEEVAAKSTLVGPHRDDFIIAKIKDQKSLPAQAGKIKNDGELFDLSKYGSRGEQRLGVLWLKLAELGFIEEKTGERPLLLLDDIFSELDEAHRELVLELIGKQQSILTSAEDEIIELFKQKKISHELIGLSIQT